MSFTANDVKELREKTSAGMMDCKKALQETNGDFEAAVEWLRKKGLSKAAKKSGRIAAEGLVHAYIHGAGRIGVLVEVNSETDFVARNEEFQTLVKDVAMHVAASAPQYLRVDEIPASQRDKEAEILKGRALEEGKKPEFVDKIIQGQLKKWEGEICLMSQKFIKNPDLSVEEHLQNCIARIGENIVVRRFTRYELGEGIEKKQSNFAEEVAAAVKG